MRCWPSLRSWTTPACCRAAAGRLCWTCRLARRRCWPLAVLPARRVAPPCSRWKRKCWSCAYRRAARQTCWLPPCSSTGSTAWTTHMEHSMEKREYTFAAGLPAAGRALAGVVGSGDLEVLLQPHQAGITVIVVHTSVDGKGAVWDALLARVFGGEPLPAASIIINDCGATPGVVRMRIEQAYEDLASGEQA